MVLASLDQPEATTTEALQHVNPPSVQLPLLGPSSRPHHSAINGNAASTTTTSTAQFLQNPMVNLVRLAMKHLDRFSPRITARLTYALISSPPRYKAKASELQFRTSAHQWRIPFQGGWLQCYRWGTGRGPICLFVHCWGGRGTQAQDMIQRLTDSGMRVVSFDHPAHGLSSGKKAEMMRMAAAVTTVINHIGHVHTLIGHSLGVAASVIALRDDAIKGALNVGRLVSISSLTHCLWFTEVVAEFLGISDATMVRARQIVDNNYAQPVGWEDLSVVNMMANLTQPILLIHDYNDLEIPFEHSVKISRALPHAQFLATKGLGHRRILKAPAVLDLITQFAREVSPDVVHKFAKKSGGST